MDINAWLEEATKRANIPAEDRKILEGVFAKNKQECKRISKKADSVSPTTTAK